MIDEKTLAKTTHGMFTSFDDVFTGAVYRKQTTSQHAGAIVDYRPGEIYLGTDWTCRDLLPNSVPPGFVLACTPVLPNLPRFSPRIGSRESGSVGPSCIKVIAWQKDSVFLVLAGDPNHIRDVWLGFVPIDQRITVADPRAK